LKEIGCKSAWTVQIPDCADANDGNHLKWRIAKYFVNAV